MFNIEDSLNRQILGFGRGRPTVVFTEALDPRLLEAVCFLTRYIRPVLLAPEKAVRKVLKQHLGHLDPHRIDFALSESAFVDIPGRPDLLEEFARSFLKLQEKRGAFTLETARQALTDPCLFGIFAVREGHADLVVGGSTHEPVQYFRPMLKYLKQDEVQCEAGVFILPDEQPEPIYPQNIIVFGDVGVNGTMSPEVLARIAVDTCTITRDLIPEKVLPRIHGAIVSYSNHGSDEGPSPELVKQATRLVPAYLEEKVRENRRYRTIFIEGEIKANVALSERSAMYYRKESRETWKGATNVLICPNLDMGNLLYHFHSIRFPSAGKFTIISGTGFSGVDMAKDCSAGDIRLAVKAPVLLKMMNGGWAETPKDTFFRRYRVLAINPGSTSTKISVYRGDSEEFTEELQHTPGELAPFEGRSITDQFTFRKEAILGFLRENGLELRALDAISARGGLLRPIPHGTYRVNDRMLKDLCAGIGGEHASNLGALIASELCTGTEIPAFIVDPIVVDEVEEKVKITGLKEMRRYIISHALNQIASARRFAEENETFYENLNLIVCHMGGGISAGAHRKGRYIDVNNALNGEGPFTPQRSGTLPVAQLIDLCFSGKYTREELKKLNKGRGGLIDLLGTSDMREVQRLREGGDGWAELVFQALAYRIAREITSLIPAFDGEPVDRIILTGGMARSAPLVERISGLTSLLGCGVTVYPGENEMMALTKGALRVLQGKEKARTYRP